MIALMLGVLAAPSAAAPPAPVQSARPSQEPIIAPMPDWVTPVAPGSPNPALADRPAQVLLSNSQSFYAAERTDHFVHMAFLIQSQQALQNLGNVILPWSPDHAELIVHSVHVIRGGAVIDLLANGQRFTVLRRENNLESATLDGVLTAAMQPEGLAVGDILDVAWTMRQHGGVLPLRAENFFAPVSTQPVRRLNIRQVWADGLPVRWHGTGAFEHADLRHTDRGTEISVDLTDYRTPEMPGDLPARLQTPSTLQLSQYRDWAEVSALLAPHYERALQLAAGSPLRAEIARIAALSEDPRVRTLAALRLVQEQVRYFALVMGEGNYLPATADQSWTRRYADCKGKTILLVTLLRALGIEAEPVLVSTANGEVLGDRLPILPLFNHMIVRARIDGRSYWLDGTRTADRNLDDLAFSTLSWGLPIRTGGMALEQLPFGPPSKPLGEVNITYDASQGLADHAPVRLEMVFRGDVANAMRMAVSQAGRDAFVRHMRESMSRDPSDEFTVEAVDVRDDAADGSFVMVATGTGEMRWNPIPGGPPAGGPRRLRFDIDAPDMRINVNRPEGEFHDAPFALEVPLYSAMTETVILPSNARGFSFEGGDLERTIAGTVFSRHVEIADGRAIVRATQRRVQREISAADARASEEQSRMLRDDKIFLRAPASAVRSAARAR